MSKKKNTEEKVSENHDKSIGFSPEEQKEIVDKVIESIEADVETLAKWTKEKAKDLKRAFGCSPAEVQGLKKKAWMSDRDIGLCGAVCDATRSTTLARTANANLLTVAPTEENDIDRSKNVERFMKWAISDPSKKFQNVLLGAISNAVWTGLGVLKVGWIRKTVYINERTMTKEGTIKYKKAEKHIHEDGFIENIHDVDDILCPDYGSNINDLDHFTVINHMTLADVEGYAETGQFINVDEAFKEAMKGKTNEQGKNTQKGVKDDTQGIAPSKRINKDASSIDIYESYRYFKKDERNEKYRFYVEKETRKFLGGKPLRDIVPSARLPYIVVPFDVIPGKIRSLSLIKKIKDLTDQINCIYNQNTDYQYVQNCPSYVASSSDTHIKGRVTVSPGDIVKSSNPDQFKLLTHQASFAWADNMLNFLLAQLEKRSGQAGQFLTNDSKKATATRDVIVDENSKVRQGLEVSAIISAFSEALNLLLEQYQYFAPATLGTRILGKNGKQLFANFKPADIMGRYDIKISEDIVGGNQAYKSNLAIKKLELGMTDPFVMNNPNGLWQLFNDTYRDLGVENPDKYQTKQPPSQDKLMEEVEDEFFRIQQGDVFEPPEGKSAQAAIHLPQHMRQREEQGYLLDEKALAELDRHILLTMKNVQMFQEELQNEQISNDLALGGQDAGIGAGGQEVVSGGMQEQGGALLNGPSQGDSTGKEGGVIQ